MKANLKWTEGMRFTVDSDGHSVDMDAKAPIGKSSAMTPKELVAAGLGGCTAMDVVALLKKHKQAYESFNVDVDVAMSKGGSPVVFTDAVLTFKLVGAADKDIFIEAVKLSQTKYCGVSAMMCKAFPIKYVVVLNGEIISEGFAAF